MKHNTTDSEFLPAPEHAGTVLVGSSLLVLSRSLLNSAQEEGSSHTLLQVTQMYHGLDLYETSRGSIHITKVILAPSGLQFFISLGSICIIQIKKLTSTSESAGGLEGRSRADQRDRDLSDLRDQSLCTHTSSASESTGVSWATLAQISTALSPARLASSWTRAACFSRSSEMFFACSYLRNKSCNSIKK